MGEIIVINAELDLSEITCIEDYIANKYLLTDTLNPTVEPTAAPTDQSSFELILNHKNVSNGLFNSSLLTTGLENENNPSANTYSIIGKFNATIREQYKGEDGKYLFKLIYHYDSYPDDILIWKQSSWLTEPNITGADLYRIPNQSPFGSGAEFHGLGLNPDTNSYLDGNSVTHFAFWWQAVGITQTYQGGIPGFNPINNTVKIAYGQSLYISNSNDAILVKQNACFDANNFTKGYSINPPYSGEIYGIELVYKSIRINCSSNTLKHWGCDKTGQSYFTIQLVKEEANDNYQTYCPKLTTDGIAYYVPCMFKM